MVNGCKVGPFMRRLTGFVHQDDIFFGSLTGKHHEWIISSLVFNFVVALEHLTVMAHTKLDRRIPSHEVEFIIRDALEKVGLSHCANTRIGKDGDGKVLSGGEKKRLSFATELLSEPSILFCDEPTTGLDSYNAQKLVETLQELAIRRKTAILCTIHQPSSDLFAMFDQVLLLAEGRIAFLGDPDAAIDFFRDHGYQCPMNYNPAEYLIDVLSTETGACERTSQRVAERICDLFAVSEASQQRDLLVNLEMHMHETGMYKVEDEANGFKQPYWQTTVYWLTWRSLLNVVRDPTVQSLRIVQKIAIALTAALCYVGSIKMTQAGVQSVTGIIFIFVAENAFTPMYSVLSIFPQTFPIFLREIRSGIYRTEQYYLANVLAMVKYFC